MKNIVLGLALINGWLVGDLVQLYIWDTPISTKSTLCYILGVISALAVVWEASRGSK